MGGRNKGSVPRVGMATDFRGSEEETSKEGSTAGASKTTPVCTQGQQETVSSQQPASSAQTTDSTAAKAAKATRMKAKTLNQPWVRMGEKLLPGREGCQDKEGQLLIFAAFFPTFLSSSQRRRRP